MQIENPQRYQLTVAGVGAALCAISLVAPEFSLRTFALGIGLLSFTAIWIATTDPSATAAVPTLIAVQLALSGLYVFPRYGIYGWDSVPFFQRVNRLAGGGSLEGIPTKLAHIFAVQLHTITGGSVEASVKYMPFLLIGVFVLGLFILTRRVFGQRQAILGTLAVSTFWWVTEFHTWSVKESLSLPLALFCLFCIHRYMQTQKWMYLFAGMVLYLAILETHTYLAIVALIALFAMEVASGVNTLGIIEATTTGGDSSAGRTGLFLPAAIATVMFISYQVAGLIVNIITSLQATRTNLYQGAPPDFVYRNVFEFLRLSWWGTRWQIAAIGFVFLVALFAVLKRRRKLTESELAWIGVIGALGILFFFAQLTDFGLTKRRALNLAWVFLIPLIAGLFSRARLRRTMYSVFGVLIVVNLAFQPYHVAMSDESPAYGAGEEEFGYYETDHRAAQWAGEYTLETVYTAEGYSSFISLYGAKDPVGESRVWMYSLSSPPAGYVYITPRERVYFRVPGQPPTTDPPEWDEASVLNRVYTTGERTIYLVASGNRS